MANAQIGAIAVQIFGEEYHIAESDALKVQKIAAYVDGKMREIASLHAGRIPTGTLAVLAAMTIADELFQALSEQNRLAETAQENLQRLAALVEERAAISPSGRAESAASTRPRWHRVEPSAME